MLYPPQNPCIFARGGGYTRGTEKLFGTNNPKFACIFYITTFKNQGEKF